MKQQWVVTGWSSKYDGFLFVVEVDFDGEFAQRAAKAIEQVAALRGQQKIDTEQYGSVLVWPDNDYTAEDFKGLDFPRHAWQVSAVPISLNENLSDAVIW